MKGIEAKSNEEHSLNKRFHKEIKIKVDANKAAAEEVKALAKSTKMKMGAVRSKMAADRLSMAQELTASTQKLYGALAEHEKTQAGISTSMKASLAGAKASTVAKMPDAKKSF